MKTLKLNQGVVCFLLAASCAGKVHSTAAEVSSTPVVQKISIEAKNPEDLAGTEARPAVNEDSMLICKTKKNHFHFDWSASSSLTEQIDQNSVRYKFQAATRPAGRRGENLKVGECGWAAKALTSNQRESSEFLMKSVSDEATQAFYKLRTGKVFKLPVRRVKTGLVVLPKSEVSVIR